jgi:dCTP deaminase
VLSDVDIIERVSDGSLTIEPYDEDNVEPASVDLRLGDSFKKTSSTYQASSRPLSLSEDDGIEWSETTGPTTISREGFVLGTTLERVSLPDDLIAQVLGRSSFGRLGISVHQTAGFIDPGFDGQITLELSNHGPQPVELQPGQRVCQIVFSELSSPSMHPYGDSDSQYQNQSGPTPSGMNFD